MWALLTILVEDMKIISQDPFFDHWLKLFFILKFKSQITLIIVSLDS